MRVLISRSSTCGAQRLLGRQPRALRLQAAHDAVGFNLQFALEHDAVVDHGGDAVEPLAAGGQLAVLGLRARGASDRQGEKAEKS